MSFLGSKTFGENIFVNFLVCFDRFGVSADLFAKHLKNLSTTDFIEKNWKKITVLNSLKKFEKTFQCWFHCKKFRKNKFRAELNFFSQKWKTDFYRLIFFSQNAWFFPENALEIWEQKVTKFCSKKKRPYFWGKKGGIKKNSPQAENLPLEKNKI
jgi:hypothetical protein